MLRSQHHRIWRRIIARHGRVPHHLEHHRLALYLPARRRIAGPLVTIKVFARLAVVREGAEIRSVRILEPEDGREARRVAAHAACARRESGMWTRHAVP